jgi:hypothetical protein
VNVDLANAMIRYNWLLASQTRYLLFPKRRSDPGGIGRTRSLQREG